MEITDTIEEKKTLLDLPEPLYFDRSKKVKELINQLKRNFFVAVTGESGSGKSTFVNVTLRENLQTTSEKDKIEGSNGATNWRIVTTMPFADPIGNLASALTDLSKPGGLFAKGSKDSDFRLQVEKILKEDDDALVRLYRQAEGESREKFNFLLIVDQKQELYRYQHLVESRNAGDDVRYVSLLLKAAKSTLPIYIIFISDTRYLEYFSRYRGLPEEMNNHRFSVPDITEEEIETALEPYLEQEFLERLIHDFKDLNKSGDPFALQKLNLSLWLAKQQNAAHQDGNLPDHFEQQGPMRDVIRNFIEKEVWNKFTPLQKARCALIFKALTKKGGENLYIREPVSLETLCKLGSRDIDSLFSYEKEHPSAMPERFGSDAGGDIGPEEIKAIETISPEEVKDILDRFNTSNEKFIRYTGPSDQPSRYIADIDSGSFCFNWPLLSEWVDEESAHIDVYRNLLTRSLNYYSKYVPPSESVPQSEASKGLGFLKQLMVSIRDTIKKKKTEEPQDSNPVDEGAALVSTRNWERTCLPDPNWANRYKDIIPEDKKKRLRASFKQQDLARMSDLAIALKFLDASKQFDANKSAQKENDIKNAFRLRKKALIWAGVATIALIVAVASFFWVRRTHNKMKLVDFVELLGFNGALDIKNAERFDKMGELYNAIKPREYNTRDEVLECLVQQKVIYIDLEDETMKRISFDALGNMDDLYQEVLTDSNGYKSFDNIRKIYDSAIKEKGAAYIQYPYVYYALMAQLRRQTSSTIHAPQSKAIIEESALVSNPARRDEFAFGDKNGKIFIQNSDRLDSVPNAGGVIMGMGYSRDGNTLFVGVEDGHIYGYDRQKIFPGNGGLSDLKSEIYTDEKTVYFIEEWDDPNYLLVSNTEQVYFLHRNTNASKWGLHGKRKLNIPLKRIGYTDWSPDRRWFFAAGKDSTIVYHLDPTGSQESEYIRETTRIVHPGVTMLDLAIKFETMNDGQVRVWLALGSEEGDIWITTTDTTVLRNGKGTDLVKSGIFVRYQGVHESSITGLEFNAKHPQLASASLDGTVQLWNLNSLSQKNDHIRLRNRGQGISAITYINPDELVAYEGISSWVLKTNIEALKEELELAIKANNH